MQRHSQSVAITSPVARSMLDCARASDTVARWGGDEFVIIAERLDSSFTAAELVGRVMDALREPIAVAGALLRVQASVGLARLDEYRTAELRVEAADQALITDRILRRSTSMAAAVSDEPQG